jgi:hypothetical protein
MTASRDCLATLAASLLAAAACDPGEVTRACPRPEIVVSAVAPNPNNVLSAVVTAEVRSAVSVALRFGSAGMLDNVTPAVVVDGETVTIPVLGLLPEREYELRLEAYGCGTATGAALGHVTSSLPADLPVYVASGPDPSPGYVAFAAGGYGLVIDNTGRVVWYHRFPNGPGLNFQPQPTGRYVAFPPVSGPAGFGKWQEVDALGNVTRAFGCAGGLPTRFHDLIALPDGSYWVMCDETRQMDLTAHGGVANAQVTGTQVQHVSESGSLLFQWSPFDHFDITDLDLSDRTGPAVNWTHGNAIDLDDEGNLLISFRSLNEITKIETSTGGVLWRMGGRRNQFSFLDTSSPAFMRQHGLRVSGRDEVLLLDNLGEPAGSRVERYELEAGAPWNNEHTARLISTYVPDSRVVAQLGGTTQPLPGGRSLAAYGNGGRVEEYDAAGQVMWRIEGNPGYIFRAQRIRSLYQPIAP